MPREYQERPTTSTMGAYNPAPVARQAIGVPVDSRPSPLGELAKILGTAGKVAVSSEEIDKQRKELAYQAERRRLSQLAARQSELEAGLKNRIAEMRIEVARTGDVGRLAEIDGQYDALRQAYPNLQNEFDEPIREIQTRRHAIETEAQQNKAALKGVLREREDKLTLSVRTDFSRWQTEDQVSQFNTEFERAKQASPDLTPEQYVMGFIAAGLDQQGDVVVDGQNLGSHTAVFGDTFVQEAFLSREVSEFMSRWHRQRADLERSNREATGLSIKSNVIDRFTHDKLAPDWSGLRDGLSLAAATQFPNKPDEQSEYVLQGEAEAIKLAVSRGNLLAAGTAWASSDRRAELAPLLYKDSTPVEFWTTAVDNALATQEAQLHSQFDLTVHFFENTPTDKVAARISQVRSIANQNLEKVLSQIPGSLDEADTNMLKAHGRLQIDNLLDKIERKVVQPSVDAINKARLADQVMRLKNDLRTDAPQKLPVDEDSRNKIFESITSEAPSGGPLVAEEGEGPMQTFGGLRSFLQSGQPITAQNFSVLSQRVQYENALIAKLDSGVPEGWVENYKALASSSQPQSQMLAAWMLKTAGPGLQPHIKAAINREFGDGAADAAFIRSWYISEQLWDSGRSKWPTDNGQSIVTEASKLDPTAMKEWLDTMDERTANELAYEIGSTKEISTPTGGKTRADVLLDAVIWETANGRDPSKMKNRVGPWGWSDDELVEASNFTNTAFLPGDLERIQKRAAIIAARGIKGMTPTKAMQMSFDMEKQNGLRLIPSGEAEFVAPEGAESYAYMAGGAVAPISGRIKVRSQSKVAVWDPQGHLDTDVEAQLEKDRSAIFNTLNEALAADTNKLKELYGVTHAQQIRPEDWLVELAVDDPEARSLMSDPNGGVPIRLIWKGDPTRQVVIDVFDKNGGRVLISKHQQ